MTRFKAMLYAFSLAAVITGGVAEVKARITVKPSEPVKVSRLAQGAPYCVSEVTIRLYSRATLDSKEDYAQSMLDRGVCAILPEPFAYEILEDAGEFAEVHVTIDDTEYEFWVEKETL